MKRQLSSGMTACVCALLLPSVTLLADVPALVAVQGELGQIKSGAATNLTQSSQAMDLMIYSGTNQSTTLFGRTNVIVQLEQGKFAAEIGNGAGLANAVSDAPYSNLPDLLADAPGSSFSLGFRPAGFASDLFPAMRLQSVPFALVAGDAKQATRTFEVRNGTASLGRLIVQGETALKGPVTFEASSTPVFSRAMSVAGEIKVTGGSTAFASLTVDNSASISNATLNGVTVSGGPATINGALTVSSGMTTVNGTTGLDPAKTLTATSNLTVRGALSAASLQAQDLTVNGTFSLPATAKIKRVFGERACIATAVSTAPTTDSGWSNSFYQVTLTSGAGSSKGYWKAPQNCFVVANYVVGRYTTGEQNAKPIALMTSASTDYATLCTEANCIAKTYCRLDLAESYAAHKGAICIYMKKGQYLCWYSDYDNQETVYGSGYMREISVIYFAN